MCGGASSVARCLILACGGAFPGPCGLESFKPFPAHPRLGEVCVNERERPGGGVESAGV